MLGALLLTSFCIMPAAALALPAQISIPRQTAAPGSSLLVPVVLDSKNSAMSGVQFDVQYDNTAITIIATIASAAKDAGKLLYAADLAPNKRRFVVFGLNPNSIPNGHSSQPIRRSESNAPAWVSFRSRFPTPRAPILMVFSSLFSAWTGS